jgi:hypothetical protein
MCTRKDFFEIYRQFSHAPSKRFASPDLVRSHWAVQNCTLTGSANQFATCPTTDSLQGITITYSSCTQFIPVRQASVTSAKSTEGKERKGRGQPTGTPCMNFNRVIFKHRPVKLVTLQIFIHMEKL